MSFPGAGWEINAGALRTVKDSGRYYARLIAGGGQAPALPRIEAFG